MKAGGDGYDPLSRRWTRSRNNYGEPEEDSKLAGSKVAGYTGMEVTAAAMEAAADAGKFVDTGAPVDQTTDFNFDLPIFLAKLKKFGGPQGAYLGYMAGKQRIKATVGRQVLDDNGKQHALSLSINDYKRRRMI